MDTAYLEVEVTESAAMENPERTFAMLDALRQRGLHVYIDDFGTGYSNLGQLKRMPIDALKIDKSLIDDVLFDTAVALVVQPQHQCVCGERGRQHFLHATVPPCAQQ